MSRKSEERKARDKKIILALSCILGVILIIDVLVFLIACQCGHTKTAVFAFLAVFVIVPPLTVLADHNLDFSKFPIFWFLD